MKAEWTHSMRVQNQFKDWSRATHFIFNTTFFHCRIYRNWSQKTALILEMKEDIFVQTFFLFSNSKDCGWEQQQNLYLKSWKKCQSVFFFCFFKDSFFFFLNEKASLVGWRKCHASLTTAKRRGVCVCALGFWVIEKGGKAFLFHAEETCCDLAEKKGKEREMLIFFSSFLCYYCCC